MTKEELLLELAKRGVKVEVSGCGCCGSPWFRVALDDQVVFGEEDANMNSIDE